MANQDDELFDTSIMTFGMYKGLTLSNVPDSYLRWFYEQNFGRKTNGFNKQLMNYIESNKETILK